MINSETDRLWRYHNGTKHSPESVRRDPHFLDWGNQPLPFKIYPDLEPLKLPDQTTQSGVAALEAIATGVAGGPRAGSSVAGLEDLTHLLYFAAGITRRRRYTGGEILFRAAACTGALYEIELYLVCGPLGQLAAGVYHFNPGDFALRLLRAGDWRGLIVEAAAGEASLGRAPAIVVSTGTYWRNAWKYRARTYRHFGWDNGTMLANLLAVAASRGLPARLVCGFTDERVNTLLGLDTAREVALSLVALGESEDTLPAPPGEPSSLDLATVALSHSEVDYPAMREMHEASSLADPGEVRAWRAHAESVDTEPEPAASPWFPLAPPAGDAVPSDTIEEVILRRGSSRRFLRHPIGLDQFSTILDRATRGIHADFHAAPGERWNDLYLTVHAVDGLRPGSYHYHGGKRPALELLKEGDFRSRAAFLALDQNLAGDAAFAVFFLADLSRMLERFGNRAYRAVQLEAGILGGKLYLGAYAHRLGATGLTFYDDAVVEFFSPHAAGKSAIFLVAMGRPAPLRG